MFKFDEEKLNQSTEKLIQEIVASNEKCATEIKKIKLFTK